MNRCEKNFEAANILADKQSVSDRIHLNHRAMITDNIFGIQLATIEPIRDVLLTDYIQWQTKKHQVDGMAFGQSPQGDAEAKKTVLFNFSEIKELLGPNEFKQYIITERALNNYKEIKVEEPFDIKWLASLEDTKKQLNFGDSLIRYKKSGPRIAVFAASLVPDAPTPYVHYSYFYLDLEKNIFPRQANKDDYEQTNGVSSTDFEYGQKVRRLFLQLLTAMKNGQMQETTLSPGQKHEMNDRSGSLLNSSQFPITLVHSHLDKLAKPQSLRVDGALPSKHRRIQQAKTKSARINKNSKGIKNYRAKK